MAPIWVARQLPSDVGRVKVGNELHLKATRDVSLGHRVLIASQDRKQFAGLGVVLGEPMKRKGKQYVRSVLVTHTFKRPRPELERQLGAKQGARPATDAESRVAREKAEEETPSSFVFKAAQQVARQLSPGVTSEKDSEALLVAMIEAAGCERVAHQVPIPGPSKPVGDKSPPSDSGRMWLRI